MKINLPGIFWIILILALIPAISAVIEQFWPTSQYYISAIIVAILAAVAKTLQIMLEKDEGASLLIEPPPDGVTPAAAPMEIAAHVEQPGKMARLFFG